MSSYQALYRKFRPATFLDVKGQDHIVTTLQNQINADRLSHAYLFCGTRGTGKTSIAKILAKAVNCEHPNNGNPCLECETCKSIGANTSMNVIEIDAASNNGVDNIRDIVEQVSYSPPQGKYKVYIIDEVHMLSMGAFNALLKTLEEPPSYVIFILATTEAHKIPITILSRCQRYDFKRISIDTISNRLEELVQKEQVVVDKKALRYIAKCGDGSMRDSLSLLDQALAFHFGEELTYDMVLDVLGAVDNKVYSGMINALIQKDVISCITLLEDVVMQGRDLTQFVTELTWYVRNLMLVKNSVDADLELILDVSTEQLQVLKEEANQLEQETIIRYIQIFSELTNQIKYANSKRILIEMTLIKICKPSMETNPEALLERVRDLESQIEKGVFVSNNENGTPVNQGASAEGLAATKKPLPKAIPEDVQQVVQKWYQIIGNLQGPMRAHLSKAKLSLGNDNRLLIVLENPNSIDYFGAEFDHKQILENSLSNAVGKEIQVTIKQLGQNEDFQSSYADLSQLIHMEIEEEE